MERFADWQVLQRNADSRPSGRGRLYRQYGADHGPTVQVAKNPYGYRATETIPTKRGRRADRCLPQPDSLVIVIKKFGARA
jgi:hypothetical protein